MTAFRISAPASSANLGSGFDAVGIALDLRMTAEVEELAPGATSAWIYSGPHAPTHDGLRGCVERGIVRIAPNAPPLRVLLDNAIPLGAGLGSSAAGHALGVAIGARLLDRMPEDDVLALAVADLEGHPDNALAAWYGGVVVAAHGEDGLTVGRFAAPPVQVVVAVPQLTLATAAARALLPESYSRADAVYNVQRAALLGAALASGRVDLLGAAMLDRLHQPYRAAALPGMTEALALRDPDLVGIALSGAGPSVLAFVRGDAVRIGARLAACFGGAATVLLPAADAHGVLVHEHRAGAAVRELAQ